MVREGESAGRHRVVVVGGGFGGLRTVRGLHRADVEVTLVDRQNSSLFQPLVYQVATGALSPAEIASPLRGVLKRQRNARVMLAEVTGFDLERRRVLLGRLRERGSPPSSSTTRWSCRAAPSTRTSAIDEWQQHAPQLKSLEGALDIRSARLGGVRGGRGRARSRAPTGLAHVRGRRRAGRPVSRWRARSLSSAVTRCAATLGWRTRAPRRVLLVEAADRVLPGFPESLSRSASPRSSEARRHAAGRPHGGRHQRRLGGDARRRRNGRPGRCPYRDLGGGRDRLAALAAVLAEAAGVRRDRAGRVPVGARPDARRRTRRCSRSATWRWCTARRGRGCRCRGWPRSPSSRAATRARRSAAGRRAASRRRSSYRDKGNVA